MKKYGFIYIWYDRKHKKYYVGAHWGHEKDGYICSSNHMKCAYKKRPHDFKRRIIKTNIETREDTFIIEQKYLDLISDDELGNRYYNLNKNKCNSWFKYDENIKTMKQKIAFKTKEAMQKPEIKERFLIGLKNRNCMQSEKTKTKRSNSMKETMNKKFPIELRKSFNKPKFNSFEYKQNMSKKSKEMWNRRDENELKEIGNKISKSLKGKQNRLGQKNSSEQNKKIRETNKITAHKKFIERAASLENIIRDTINLSCIEVQRTYNITRQTVKKLRKHFGLG